MTKERMVRMDTTSIIAALDAEIAKLQEARALLSRIATATVAKQVAVPKPRKRRRLSKNARERIAAAQRKRWAYAYGQAHG
jgi:hypothetical protein